MTSSSAAQWWQSPTILSTKVMHKRTRPRENAFVYDVYYLCVPDNKMGVLDKGMISRNRFGLLSYYDRDHGLRDGSDAMQWARGLLQQCNLDNGIASIIVIAMPRTLGFVFNPVSFWMCLAENGELKVVIAEVNNTFGEAHSYVLAHADGSFIGADDWLEADKNFHVSPFLAVEGSYRFRFAMKATLGIWIDYLGPDGEPTLLTSMACKPEPFTQINLIKHALRTPMVSLKALILIHWQAIKLMIKKITYHRKPAAPSTEYTQWRR